MRLIATALAALCTLALTGSLARAEELWSVRSGQVVLHLNVDLLGDLGIDVAVEGGDATLHSDDVLIEEPHWTFALRRGTDLKFRADRGVVLPRGAVGGALRLDGAIVLTDRKSGLQVRLADIEIADGPAAPKGSAGEGGADPLLLRSATTRLAFFELIHSMFRFARKDQQLQIHYLNALVTAEGARALGRPELAGWIVGMGEVRAEAALLSSTPSTKAAYRPRFKAGLGDTLDVSLGILSSIQQVGRDGVFPNGRVGLSMSTTSCNLGNVDVPWLAPMEEDHPLIHMALYRLLNGRFEQIGVSWMKHGFFALSSSQCTPCAHPSDGSFLGVGCSDTYSVSNNASRSYLGPRKEINAYTSVWTCMGSHFANDSMDCVRRHGSSNHTNDVDHRLAVRDADLNNSGATYYYESYYIVRNDENLHNNWGSRRCIMAGGPTWAFSTPSTGNDLIAGPALNRWGELRTTVQVEATDGEVLLAVQTTDLGGGMWRYEYALLNKNSDRQIRSFSIPVAGVGNISNIGFTDNDHDATTDWTVAVENNNITWQTQTHAQNPNANALVFGYQFNFRFDANSPPTNQDATLGLFKPGAGTQVTAGTRTPTNLLTDVDGIEAATPRLLGVRPNPFDRTTAISFSTVTPGARLEIYDAAGRRVRGLVDDQREAGIHTVVWDGNADGGARVSPGVYYARLRDGGRTSVKSVVVVE